MAVSAMKYAHWTILQMLSVADGSYTYEQPCLRRSLTSVNSRSTELSRMVNSSKKVGSVMYSSWQATRNTWVSFDWLKDLGSLTLAPDADQSLASGRRSSTRSLYSSVCEWLNDTPALERFILRIVTTLSVAVELSNAAQYGDGSECGRQNRLDQAKFTRSPQARDHRRCDQKVR